MTTKNTRWGNTQRKNAVIKKGIILRNNFAEFNSGSSTPVVTKRHALKALKPVQELSNFTTTCGFTLIELLVVVLIIGILAAVAVPQYQVAVKKADLSRYMQLVRSLREAEEVYYLENGTYTSDLRLLSIEAPQGSDCVLTKYSAYYNCPTTTVRYGIFNNATNAQAGDSSIRYVQYFADYSSESDANGFQYTKGTIACYSKGDVARKACRSLGTGEEYESGNTTWDYYFILK